MKSPSVGRQFCYVGILVPKSWQGLGPKERRPMFGHHLPYSGRGILVGLSPLQHNENKYLKCLENNISHKVRQSIVHTAQQA